VAWPRTTLRTVARDTDSVRTISLFGRCSSKYARLIRPMSSTPIIPHTPFPADTGTTEGRLTRSLGRGVIIRRENRPSGGHYCARFYRQPLDLHVDPSREALDRAGQALFADVAPGADEVGSDADLDPHGSISLFRTPCEPWRPS